MGSWGMAVLVAMHCTTRLVLEVADTREQAGHPSLLTEIERFLVSFGSSRVHDAVHTSVDEDLRAIREGEECITGCDDCSRGVGLLDR